MNELIQEMDRLGDSERARKLQGYFKTGPGEYGEGDVFLGLTVPQQRKLSHQYYDMALEQLDLMLHSKIHEHRLTALFILVHRYEKTHDPALVEFYLHHTKQINNWDLVDSSAPYILGPHLLDKPRKLLYQLAKSENLWERRIAMLACFTFIHEEDYKDGLAIAEILLADNHDLIHKAVGWMLREIGKKNQAVEENFLKKHYHVMPRTMLRYAIEHFPEPLRQAYLKGKI